jgi:hypothetical protein
MRPAMVTKLLATRFLGKMRLAAAQGDPSPSTRDRQPTGEASGGRLEHGAAEPERRPAVCFPVKTGPVTREHGVAARLSRTPHPEAGAPAESRKRNSRRETGPAAEGFGTGRLGCGMKTRPANPSHPARRSKNGGASGEVYEDENRVATRNPSTLQRHTKASAQKHNTRKKRIGGAGALERLHGKSESPAAPNPSSKGEPAHGCVVAGGRREHEAKTDSGGASQTENENRKKDGAQLQEENANEVDGA